MSNIKYPEKWPLPDRKQPTLLQSRITEDQKLALYNRNISTRELASILKCHETYLSGMFPGKVPLANRKELLDTRKAYKLTVAREILLGKYSIREAAELAFTSYNTMHRCVAKAKELHPELVTGYALIVRANRQETAEAARQVRSAYAKATP